MQNCVNGFDSDCNSNTVFKNCSGSPITFLKIPYFPEVGMSHLTKECNFQWYLEKYPSQFSRGAIAPPPQEPAVYET